MSASPTVEMCGAYLKKSLKKILSMILFSATIIETVTTMRWSLSHSKKKHGSDSAPAALSSLTA